MVGLAWLVRFQSINQSAREGVSQSVIYEVGSSTSQNHDNSSDDKDVIFWFEALTVTRGTDLTRMSVGEIVLVLVLIQLPSTLRLSNVP